MAEFDIEEIHSETKKVVRQASQDNTLHEITPRQIRQRVEEQLGVEEGSLDAKEYRNVVKIATAEAIEELESPDHQQNEDETQTSAAEKTKKASKRKSNVTTAEPKKKARTERADQARPKEKKKAKDTSKKVKGQRVVRSASVVPSSGEEDNGRQQATTSKVSVERHEKIDGGEINVSTHEDPEPQREAQAEEPPRDRDSNVSELEDDAPKHARSKKPAKGSAEKPTKGRKRKGKEIPDESPEDQELKRLKSFVTACGVRKVWSKEFKDIPDDKHAQARRLRSILADLGMTGRLSLEKAKAIRAKRELAQELEDVQNFQQAVVSGATKSRRPQPQGRPQASQSGDEGDDVSRKPRGNARMSIMTFLGDQSDDD
ncbi:hypothetical protein PHLGIDRAFT_129918 [Phlebiopsis gigantea 11061_1 CR5-6]|uniref:DEK C-terminal domain-containing protein n=1 Tax=Phlebiopsis gigantea (strain 11061_1 CR5-6) TaxID=745531 RepID=A0A0C3S2G4_PHLG1|nr:hypothetical protein PHLGIDRAFT_129918 [Phlebiopsis gigantea 11061_1 CR5-6]